MTPAEIEKAAKGLTNQEARDDEVRKVVEWLREEAQTCDCFARSARECACGAWDTCPGDRSYKTMQVEDLADALERYEHRKEA